MRVITRHASDHSSCEWSLIMQVITTHSICEWHLSCEWWSSFKWSLVMRVIIHHASDHSCNWSLIIRVITCNCIWNSFKVTYKILRGVKVLNIIMRVITRHASDHSTCEWSLILVVVIKHAINHLLASKIDLNQHTKCLFQRNKVVILQISKQKKKIVGW